MSAIAAWDVEHPIACVQIELADNHVYFVLGVLFRHYLAPELKRHAVKEISIPVCSNHAT
jgi:hypothetical protein